MIEIIIIDNNSNVSQIVSFKSKYRKIQLVYTDHDGFDDRELTKFIIKYSANKYNFQYLKKGFSTIHIFLKRKQ